MKFIKKLKIRIKELLINQFLEIKIFSKKVNIKYNFIY